VNYEILCPICQTRVSMPHSCSMGAYLRDDRDAELATLRTIVHELAAEPGCWCAFATGVLRAVKADDGRVEPHDARCLRVREALG
jgi:hypothetical protein